MLLTLCEYSVPMLRAAWFIKMTSFYHESKVAESKKKRQQPDISQGMNYLNLHRQKTTNSFAYFIHMIIF